MKTYQKGRKNVLTALAVVAILAAFVFCFRSTLFDLVRINWKLTVGENKKVCTPQDRLDYLRKHPQQIRIAMLGNWSGTFSEKQYKELLELAISRINQAGGIKGRQIVPEWMEADNSMDEVNEYVERIAYNPSYYAIIWAGTTGQLLTAKSLLKAYQLLTFAPAIGSVNAAKTPCIFLPNASDVQEVGELRVWAKNGLRNNFILINEYQSSEMEYAKHVERMFFENKIDVLARSIYNPADNINFYLDMLKTFCGYFDIRHAMIINHSRIPETYEQMEKWLLTHTAGDVFFRTPIFGEFSDNDRKRIYSHFYYDQKDAAKIYHEIKGVKYACFNSSALIIYRSVFLFADACSQAKSLHQHDVVSVLCNNELKSPFGSFRFTPDHFEKNPVIRIISLHEFFTVWMKGLVERPVKISLPPPPVSSEYFRNGLPAVAADNP